MELEPTDQDLIHFIKNILHTRVIPINYENLYDLVKQGPQHLKTFAEQNYSDEKFLNFLLSHADIFCVNPDGVVTLLGGTEYAIPQGIDVVDSVTCISDESYFGDREEYISDTEEDEDESTNSIDSAHNLLDKEKSSNRPHDFLCRVGKREALLLPKQEVNICARKEECPCNESSSSDSSQDYLSSESESRSSTTSDSQSSFASCPEVEPHHQFSDSSCLFVNSSSSSYSSCSES